MRLIEYIYQLLVNKNPDIAMQYQNYRRKAHGLQRFGAWLYLIWLNVNYHIFKRQSWNQNDCFFEKKLLYTKGSESSLAKQEKPEVLARRLAEYDVISFDVFDTLIFRPFSKPTDLFFIVGEQLGYLDFERIRIEIEQRSRKRKYQESHTNEVTLEEIWDEMEWETGIPKEIGLQTEWNCEYQYCFANPYMLEVVKLLYDMGKTIVATSDMYLGKRYIQMLLEHCGFPKFSGYFVSCDHGKSKQAGSLYEEVKNVYGRNIKYAHIGDHSISDGKQAKRHGFSSFLYQNVNESGMKYRAEDMSVINGSIYRGLVNSYIYNGVKEYSMSYEYGFIYGGFFVLGYCQWIHEYVQKNQIDKILFLARDGDILSKVYSRLYPEEKPQEKWEYVYWSRLAATKMTAGYFKYDYFRRFLYHKVNQGYCLKNIFSSMELDDMLSGFLNSREAAGKYTEKSMLGEEAAECIRNYLQNHWNTVLNHYEEQIKAGKQYYEKVLHGCRKAAAVDVGWAGSGAVTLNYLVDHVWNLNCQITGLLAGTNSIFNHEPNASEPLLHGGKLVSYLFSQEHNRDAWKIHNPNSGHNLVVELLLASGEKSFRKFTEKEQKFEFDASEPEVQYEEIQKGILDFISYYLERMQEIPKISGRDAFAPIEIILKNQEWMKQIIISEHLKMNLE